ncbi:MAG: hypothetical protein QOE64_1699 [Frankiales bacterium]|nr:hypothetical protein [Frankiales bacterium]
MVAQPDGADAGLRLGFACRWTERRELMWSGSALRLLDSLTRRCDVSDLPINPSPVATRLMRASERLGLTGGTPWAMTRVEDWRTEQRLARLSDRADLDAVVEIGDLGATRVPYYLYLDLSYAVANAATASTGGTGVSPLPVAVRRRKEARQRQLFAGAAGVLTMGRWFADELVGSGYPAARVHVVGAGCNVEPVPRLRSPDPGAMRLLFVGRDFLRKGGDAVVGALAALRAAGARHRLTVVGPPAWPLAGPIPDGVDYRGTVPAAEVGSLLDAHDVLLMPSRFEAFGIALLEALAAGMPVVARRAFAMPELVPEDRGVLVDEADPGQVADAIRQLAADPDVWSRCYADAGRTRTEWSWDAVAGRMLGAIR